MFDIDPEEALAALDALVAERDEAYRRVGDADAQRMVAIRKNEAAWAENERLRDALEATDWYVRCLEDIQDGRVVRGLAEAKAGYDSARDAALAREEDT